MLVLNANVIESVCRGFNFPTDPLAGFFPLHTAAIVDLRILVRIRLGQGAALVGAGPQRRVRLLKVIFSLEQFQNAFHISIALGLMEREIILIGNHMRFLLEGNRLQQQGSSVKGNRKLMLTGFQIEAQVTVNAGLVIQILLSPLRSLRCLRTQIITVFILTDFTVFIYATQYTAVCFNKRNFAIQLKAEEDLCIAFSEGEILHFNAVQTRSGYIYSKNDFFAQSLNIHTGGRAFQILICCSAGSFCQIIGLNHLELSQIHGNFLVRTRLIFMTLLIEVICVLIAKGICIIGPVLV